MIPRTGIAGAVCGVVVALSLLGFAFAAMSRSVPVTVFGLLGLVCIGALLGWMAR